MIFLCNLGVVEHTIGFAFSAKGYDLAVVAHLVVAWAGISGQLFFAGTLAAFPAHAWRT